MGKEEEDDGSISIGGRMVNERERLLGMTDLERAWRAKYLKSQTLEHDEPIMTPELFKKFNNPIRRIYKAPLIAIENTLTPIVGPVSAGVCRRLVGKFTLFTIALWVCWYNFKYNAHTWYGERHWTVTYQEALFPGEPNYGTPCTKKPNEYNSRGFENSPI